MADYNALAGYMHCYHLEEPSIILRLSCLINPRRTYTVRVTVVVPCVSMCVCLCVCVCVLLVFCHHVQSKPQNIGTYGFTTA